MDTSITVGIWHFYCCMSITSEIYCMLCSAPGSVGGETARVSGLIWSKLVVEGDLPSCRISLESLVWENSVIESSFES